MLDTLNTRCAQRIHAATFAKGVRSIGIAAAETQSNAGELAREIAAVTAGFGKRVMLVNSRETSDFGVRGKDVSDFMQGAVKNNDGFLEVRISRGSDAHRMMNDSNQLKLLMAGLDALVDVIVFDLPAHDEAMPAIYAPIAASALEAVFLVALPNVTTNQKLLDAISWLRESDAKVAGLVVNDKFNPTLGEEIVREARRLRRILPFLPGFAARRRPKW